MKLISICTYNNKADRVINSGDKTAVPFLYSLFLKNLYPRTYLKIVKYNINKQNTNINNFFINFVKDPSRLQESTTTFSSTLGSGLILSSFGVVSER